MIYPTLQYPNPHKSSGINYDELWEYFPIFFDKCSKFATNSFVKSTLEHLEDWDSISWKQFAIIMTLSKKKFNENDCWGTLNCKLDAENWFYNRGNLFIICKEVDKTPCTDYQFDKLYIQIYNSPPRFYEEEEYGKVRTYDKQGRRLFS